LVKLNETPGNNKQITKELYAGQMEGLRKRSGNYIKQETMENTVLTEKCPSVL
jgi:hypothetical protein